MMILLLTRDGGDLWEGELEEDLLLVIHHVHPRPVHRDDHVVLRQVRTWGAAQWYNNHKMGFGGLRHTAV